jgi:hypothetical protein
MYTLRSPIILNYSKKLLSKAIDTSCISKEASLDRKTFLLFNIEMNDLVATKS